MQIVLDASGWRDEGDAWQAILTALNAPDWHGRNLDALEETLRDRPGAMELTDLPQGLWPFVVRLGAVFYDLAAEGVRVELRFS